MSEWFKEAVLRTVARSARGFEPHSQHLIAPIAQLVERQAVNL